MISNQERSDAHLATHDPGNAVILEWEQGTKKKGSFPTVICFSHGLGPQIGSISHATEMKMKMKIVMNWSALAL